MRNKELTKFLTYSAEQKTGKGIRKMFEHVVQAYDTAEQVHAYAIADNNTDEYIGSCGFSPYGPGSIEFYYNVTAESCGHGYAAEAEASKALVAALPEELEVRLYCHPDNKAAHSVARKCGFAHQGIAYNKNTKTEAELFIRTVANIGTTKPIGFL